jgi:hypothetical protein
VVAEAVADADVVVRAVAVVLVAETRVVTRYTKPAHNPQRTFLSAHQNHIAQ